MSIGLDNFIHFVFIGIIALFPVINPIGSAFIVSPYFNGLNRKEQRFAVKKIAFYTFLLCTITLFTGRWILELFGITVPIIQLAGGIMICKLGWESLSAKNDHETIKERKPEAVADQVLENLDDKIFYPITFPVTAGAGTISVILTLSAQTTTINLSEYFINTGAIITAIIAMSILVFICYLNANKLVHFLGPRNEQIISRIMAFLIFCVGLQIAVSGITHLIKAYR
ncbi:MAG: MarC family protein [Chitinophagaceae bacterium]